MNKKRPKKRVYDNSNAAKIFELCKKADPNKKGVNVDWEKIISRYTRLPNDERISSDDQAEEFIDSDSDSDSEPDEELVSHDVEGQPNVGKSTIINSLMGKTVVSSSRTPGHTKHFQTIHISQNLRLCDCPGLVFPCYIERPLQILMGLYNIAQVQEPYSSIQYLAERVPVEKILSLKMPEHNRTEIWSAWDITEAYAIDRGFYTSQAARPDTYRAGLAILKLCLDGRILLSFKPPGFFGKENIYLKMKILEEDEENSKLENSSERSNSSSNSDDDDSESSNYQSNRAKRGSDKSMFHMLDPNTMI
ncbi:Guanine nucleotide-binding protein-like 1 [Smittium mucronatum]|uniref:Guanine nucleotide-binding protein-like 1 n=1 Tax=Smittium mucronatum TaxID=133383 RepID=A0A1R0GME6_9FUNG|nr:Guanine nucleotide-binding protein-like 1 [Smittium mucronatum]